MADSVAVELRDAPDSASLPFLLARLRTAEGEFARSETTGAWVLPNDHLLFAEFYDYGAAAVEALADCIDDPTPSRVLLLGEPVVVGVLCGLALQSTAYPLEHEDGRGAWVGTVLPTASADELQRAKAAWLGVVESGAYRIA